MISRIQRQGVYRRKISGFVKQVVFSIGGELLTQSGKTEQRELGRAFTGKKKRDLLTNSPLLSPLLPLSNCFSDVQTGHKFREKANLKQTNQLRRRRVYASFYKQRSDISHAKEQACYTLCMPRSISKDPT